MKPVLLLACVFTLLVFSFGWAQQQTPQQESDPVSEEQEVGLEEMDPAVDRTRRQILMLDDIYKGGIVLITEHYVDGDGDLPAGTAFKKLFEAAKEKGWHEVRLVDATGEPYNDENVAITDFEKQAIEALKAGKPFAEKTVTEEGKRFMLAATSHPGRHGEMHHVPCQLRHR